MRKTMNTRSRSLVAAVAVIGLLAWCGQAIAQGANAGGGSKAPADAWQFSITPYLWLPNINGTLKYNIPPGAGGSPSVEVGPNDYLQALNFAMMISGEVRKDRWSVFTDLIYLDFSNGKSAVKSINFGGNEVSSSVNASTNSSLTGAIWTLAAGYAVLPDRPVALDVFGGFRYAGLKASTDWQLTVDVIGPGGGGLSFPRSGSISERMDLWDAIIGVRGRFWLGGSNWSIPYYLDVGTGSSTVTWQGLLGVAYTFSWGDVTLAYRNLYYDQSDDKLIQDMRFSGFALAATFRF